VRRLHSGKNPAFSIMQDYQRQEYISRERILHPELFPPTKEQMRCLSRFNNIPAYIDRMPRVSVKKSCLLNSIRSSKVSIVELKIYARDNDIKTDLSEVKWYSEIELNCIRVRTESVEDKNKTRDSIICGRFRSEDDEYDSDLDDEDSDQEDIFVFGQVRYIIRWEDRTLLNVNWFTTERDEVSEDQRNGLEPIRVREGRKRGQGMNDWIDVDHLVIQEHMVIDVERADNVKVFHLVIRI
jgi:hypothetical protein